MFESHGPLNKSRINSSFHVELHLRTGELAVKRDELVPVGWKAWKGENCGTGRTYHFISDAGLSSSRLLSTLNKGKQKFPRVTSHLLASCPLLLPLLPLKGATFNPAAKRGCIVCLPPPPHLSLFELTKRLRWWGDCRLSFAEPTAVLAVQL